MNILVVDDRSENREVLQIKLSAHGYTSDTAADGAEALVKLRRQKYDAVVTDLLMPVMDGYQLTHAIKSSDTMAAVPVIVYTSTFTDPKDEALARNLGANAFLLKPAADGQFFGLLAETIARAGRGELPSHRLGQDEVQYLREYTARLIQKLEDKVEEVATLNATLEQRVRDATSELREANLELEAYVNAVTHDLRLPLRAIEGYCSALLEDNDLAPGERRNLLDRVCQRASSMQQLMRDLLEYSRLKQGQIQVVPLELSEVVEQAVDRMALELKRSNAHLEIAQRMPRAIGYGPVLTQAVTNLLSNAVKFVAPSAQARVAIEAVQTGDRVRLVVRDNGIGIRECDRDRIFKAFERLHDPMLYPGTGLGLAMVQRAIRKMGGELDFTSEPGKGSTFWIELPAVAERTMLAAAG